MYIYNHFTIYDFRVFYDVLYIALLHCIWIVRCNFTIMFMGPGRSILS